MKKIFILTCAAIFFMSLTATSVEASHGKWTSSFEPNAAGGTTVTLTCIYSLFIKECNVGEIVIVQVPEN